MATVTRENIGQLHDKLIVKVSKDDYWDSFEKALKNYGKNAHIPGFRKGHVPMGMVRKMYGQSLYVDEILRTVSKELNNFLQTEQQKIFAQPVAMESEEPINFDMNQPGEYAFPFEIGIQPEIEITPLQTKKGSLVHYKITIDDEALQEEVEQIRRRLGTAEKLESIDNQEDNLLVDIIATDENGTALPEAQPVSSTINMKNLPEALWEQLKGKGIGATVDFVPSTVCKPEELDNFTQAYMEINPEDNEKKNGHYKLTVTGIEHLVLHDINEELFEKTFPGLEIKTADDFHTELRKIMERQVAPYATSRLNDEIFEMLVHETPIDLPVEFLKTWMRKGGESEKTPEEVEQEFPGFDHQLRWTLISNNLIERYQLQVSQEEIIESIKANAMRYFGIAPGDEENVPWIDTYVNRLLKEEKTLEETHQRLLVDKLFSKLAEELEVKEQEIDLKSFAQLPSSHHHHH